MLVAPRGASPGRLGDVEDGVHAQELMRIDRLAAIGRIARQLRLVDLGIDLAVVDVDLLVIRRRGAALAAIRSRRRQGAVPDVVIEDAAQLRQRAGGQRDDAGKTVRGARRHRLGVAHAARFELGERRIGMRRDEMVEIEIMHPGDADEQHAIGTIRRRLRRAAGERCRDSDGSSKAQDRGRRHGLFPR